MKQERNLNNNRTSQFKNIDIIRSGFLMKKSKYLKEWRKRWVILTYHQLITYTDPQCKQITQKIHLNSVQSIKSFVFKQDKNQYLQFNIKASHQSFHFLTQNIQEKWSWIVTLQRLFHLRNIGTTSYNNYVFINSKGFNSANQFLHKNDIQQNIDKLNMIETAKILQNSLDTNKKEILQQKIKVKKSFAEIQKQKHILQKERQIINEQIQLLHQNNIEVQNYIETTKIQQNTKQISKDQVKQKRQFIIKNILYQFQYKSIGLQNASIFIDFIIKIFYKDKFGFRETINKVFKQYHKKSRRFVQGLVQIMSYSKKCLGMTAFFIQNIWMKCPQIYSQQEIPIILEKLLLMLFSLKNINNHQILDLINAIYIFNQLKPFKSEKQVCLKLKKIKQQVNNFQIKNKIQKIMKAFVNVE